MSQSTSGKRLTTGNAFVNLGGIVSYRQLREAKCSLLCAGTNVREVCCDIEVSGFVVEDNADAEQNRHCNAQNEEGRQIEENADDIER